MKAGLACPDWPLCFGDFIPDYHPQVYLEFLHRALAGLVALVTFALSYFIFRSRASRFLKGLTGFALVLLMVQVVFGGLTVLLLLKSNVVVTHLMLGTTFFSSLLWIYLTLRQSPQPQEPSLAPTPRWLIPLCVFAALAIYGQIFLGGLVAAHFASLVCTDFPTCHGQWFPTFSGIIGLHVIHRLGAYTLFAVLLGTWLVMRRGAPTLALRRRSGWLFALVCGQVGLGIANVLFHTPPLLAVGHLAMGVTLLSVALLQLRTALTLAEVSPSITGSRTKITADNRVGFPDGPVVPT